MDENVTVTVLGIGHTTVNVPLSYMPPAPKRRRYEFYWSCIKSFQDLRAWETVKYYTGVNVIHLSAQEIAIDELNLNPQCRIAINHLIKRGALLEIIQDLPVFTNGMWAGTSGYSGFSGYSQQGQGWLHTSTNSITQMLPSVTTNSTIVKRKPWWRG